MISQNELVSTLKYFELDEDDAIIYLGLLRAGSITVGNLSVTLEIDRGKTYRALNKLRNLGLITTTMSNPTICKAVDPEDALAYIIQRRKDEITTMEKLSKQIVSDLKEIQRPTTPAEVSSFSIIQGRSNIYTRIGKLIQDSVGVVYIITTMDDIMRMYHTAIPEKIKICIRNGGEVRLLTEMSNKDAVPLIERLGASETRIAKLPSKGRTIVEKDRQIFMSGSMKGSMDLNDETDSIVHTNSSEIVNNIFSLCTHLWKTAKLPTVIYESRS